MLSESLHAKIAKFEASLSERELLRMRQLRAADADGKLLGGQPSYDEGLRRLKDHPKFSIADRQEANRSLREKLKAFQSTLTGAETTELIMELSGDVGKHMSSFGVEG